MNLFNFIVWLSVGAVIGWFASRMVQLERRQIQKPLPGKQSTTKRS